MMPCCVGYRAVDVKCSNCCNCVCGWFGLPVLRLLMHNCVALSAHQEGGLGY